jgi:hypothetical protein
VPAFKGLIQTLQDFQGTSILAFEIIQPGIQKLEDYQDETTYAPAHILATCEFHKFLIALTNNYQSAQPIYEPTVVHRT